MRVYLDHNAGVPMRREVFEAMWALLLGEPAANASSPHGPGQRARYRIEQAREEIAALIGCEPAEIVFTSGGTEADNLAVLGFMEGRAGGEPAPHVVSTTIEHPAVEECLKSLEERGVRISRVRVGASGAVDAGEVEASFLPETVLASVMLANNETGAIQPVAEIARRARARGITVHSDAVQAAGRIPFDVRSLGVDVLSISAHKMGGPQGVGALYLRRGIELAPRLLGGPQERRRRAGTEPAALIAGFGEAARLAREEMGRWEGVTRPLRDRFEGEMTARFPEARFHPAPLRLPNTSSVAFPGHSAEAIVMALDLEGIAVSTGSACSSGAALPSRVLAAMGLPEWEVRSTIRVSFGPSNAEHDVERLLAALGEIVARQSHLTTAGGELRGARS